MDRIQLFIIHSEILKEYPVLVDIIDIHTPARYYINTARTGTGTNLYYPDKDSDLFDYNEDDFLYKCTRDELNGTEDSGETSAFAETMAFVDSEISYIRKQAYIEYPFLKDG